MDESMQETSVFFESFALKTLMGAVQEVYEKTHNEINAYKPLLIKVISDYWGKYIAEYLKQVYEEDENYEDKFDYMDAEVFADDTPDREIVLGIFTINQASIVDFLKKSPLYEFLYNVFISAISHDEGQQILDSLIDNIAKDLFQETPFMEFVEQHFPMPPLLGSPWQESYDEIDQILIVSYLCTKRYQWDDLLDKFDRNPVFVRICSYKEDILSSDSEDEDFQKEFFPYSIRCWALYKNLDTNEYYHIYMRSIFGDEVFEVFEGREDEAPEALSDPFGGFDVRILRSNNEKLWRLLIEAEDEEELVSICYQHPMIMRRMRDQLVNLVSKTHMSTLLKLLVS